MTKVTDLRMPAEWEPQAAIWLSWPHNIETWPTNLDQAQQEFVTLVKTISQSQSVNVMAAPHLIDSASSTVGNIPNVAWIPIPTNDAWARDYAPTFVKNSDDELVVVDWRYNAWGGKYPPFVDDARVGQLVAKHLGIEIVDPDFCFEGGAIEVNGNGLLLSTSTCALDSNRNPNASLNGLETLFAKYLGVSEVIWLHNECIAGDDTDGHIDQMARFTDEKTIVYAWQENDDSSVSHKMKRNLEDLQFQLMAKSLDGFALIPLPNPEPFKFCDRQIPASYGNFMITNEMVIVPQFDQPSDQQAIEILKPLFKGRDVVGLPSLNLSVGLGSFHCLSQHQPA